MRKASFVFLFALLAASQTPAAELSLGALKDWRIVVAEGAATTERYAAEDFSRWLGRRFVPVGLLSGKPGASQIRRAPALQHRHP